LQGLERAGLIAISENSEDARSRNVTLTLSGKAKLDEVLPGYFAILHRPDPAADK
jgi:DNA-binding MarR family transcriptional regulator